MTNLGACHLRAVRELEPNAYGVPIRQAVSAMLGRDVSIGSVYATLGQLEDAGLVVSYEDEATPERGGRYKRYWRTTEEGTHALNAPPAIRIMWSKLVQNR